MLYEVITVDSFGQKQIINLQAGQMAFTVCQIPVIYQSSNENRIFVFFNDGRQLTIDGLVVAQDLSSQIFRRENTVHRMIVSLANLKG